MRSLTDVLMVVKRRFCTRKPLPGTPGIESLIVATSNVGFASGAIAFGGGGGSGMVHAVSAVARVRFSGNVPGPCDQVPVIVFASELSFPSYVPPMPGTVIFMFEPDTVIAPEGAPGPGWSIL